jgi:hypothetical protein
MEYHLIKLNVNGTYLGLVDPSYKSRIMCFRDKPTADKCVQYVSSFRSRHGIWPSFDMYEKRKKIESSSVKLRTPEEVMRYLEIESFDSYTMDQMSRRTNSSFYCVNRFDSDISFTTETIDMSGNEIDAVVDDFAYRDLLEYKLKCE